MVFAILLKRVIFQNLMHKIDMVNKAIGRK